MLKQGWKILCQQAESSGFRSRSILDPST